VNDLITEEPRKKAKKGIKDAEKDKNSKKKDVPDEFLDQFKDLAELLHGYLSKNWSGLSKKKVRDYIELLWDLVNEKDEKEK
ncbi:MAG: hypothetical protein GY760_04020, partial [Deltaproteobacteria bacterium]|nr:hypothetical protein [Deltaproteobacteria bacterium]